MSRLPALLLLLLPLHGQGPAVDDLHILHARVHDGRSFLEGRPGVAVKGGRLAAVGGLEGRKAASSIDASGLVLAPGFVDLHVHADEEALSRGAAANFLQMGVTTVISGNCGSSVLDVGRHLEAIEARGIGVNYGTLVGHGTVRARVLGSVRRAPTASELRAMEELVRTAMAEGAFGLSTGLIYVPGTYADTDEITALVRVVAGFGGLYASHIRSEEAQVFDALEEVLAIGAAAGVPVHVSHLKASGKAQHGLASRILQRLEEARAEGRAVTADHYAYAASSTSLDVLFPSEALQGGRNRFAHRLATDPEFRHGMRQALLATMDRAGFGDLGYAQVARAPHAPEAEGLTLRALAARDGQEATREAQAEAAIELMVRSRGERTGMVYHKMDEADVERFLQAPWVAVASDSGIRDARDGKPHPRGTGNNARVLGRYVRERGVLDLGTALAKMCSVPAQAFGLLDRGRIAPGLPADLVLFDPDTVADQATYEEPLRPPTGFRLVLVNGQVAARDGVLEPGRHGRALRHARPR
jgi:N-acyl-D-amino-acid deacylase